MRSAPSSSGAGDPSAEMVTIPPDPAPSPPGLHFPGPLPHGHNSRSAVSTFYA